MAKTIDGLNGAIDLLKKVGYNHIENNGVHFVAFRRIPNSDDKRSVREIFKLARCYGERGAFVCKAGLKKDSSTNRKRERQAIQAGKAEDLPLNKPLHRADPWNYD